MSSAICVIVMVILFKVKPLIFQLALSEMDMTSATNTKSNENIGHPCYFLPLINQGFPNIEVTLIQKEEKG